MEPSKPYHQAHTFLRWSLLGVATYGGPGMVLAGNTVAVRLFDGLGFGPNHLNNDGKKYAVFCFGVLGSVIVGWMSSLYYLLEVSAPSQSNAALRRLARRGICVSTCTWFLFDTGFSLAIGRINHALFNLPFSCVLLGPLYIMHQSDNEYDAIE